MPVSVSDIAGGFLAPALFAAVAMVAFHRLLPEKLANRIAATIALGGGFVLGYALLALGEWSPRFFWHWLPYVVIGTLPAGPLIATTNWQRVAGIVITLAVFVLGGWLLVPTWPHLEPSRMFYMAAWIPAVFALAMLLDPLTRDDGREVLPRSLLITTMTATVFFEVVIIFLSGSLRFTQLAGAAAGAVLGVFMTLCLDRKVSGIAGVAPTFVMLTAGLLLVAQVDSHSSVPLASYVLVPLAPVALWIAFVKPLRELHGWKQWLALLPLPLVLLFSALLLAMIAEFGQQESW